MYKLDLVKAEEIDQIANIFWIIEEEREFPPKIYFCFIKYVRAFDCVDHNKLWKVLKEVGTPEYLTCLLRKLYADQEATVRTRHGTMDWFKTGNGVHQGCILSPYLFNIWRVYHAKCWLVESQAGIEIARRNINNLRYADNTTLLSESEEKLKTLLIRVKEESEKAGLKLTILKTEIMSSVPSLHDK